MSINNQIAFLRDEYIPLLNQCDPDLKANWGKMNFQQMVEHMSYSIKIANGNLSFPLMTPLEKVEQMKAFAVGDKPFRENTPNPLIGEDTVPLKFVDIKSAINDLNDQLKKFFSHFEENPGLRVENPFFGMMDYQEWVALLAKHAKHHLKQFGL